MNIQLINLSEISHCVRNDKWRSNYSCHSDRATQERQPVPIYREGILFKQRFLGALPPTSVKLCRNDT